MTRPSHWILLALGVVPMASAWAGGLRALDQTIFGMDCAPCAAGIEKGLRNLHGVQSVRVSLNEGKAVVAFSPESRATLEQVREVIRHNGFTPKDARGTLVGRLRQEGDRWWIETGRERFQLEGDPARLRNLATEEAAAEEVALSVLIPGRLASPPVVTLAAPYSAH